MKIATADKWFSLFIRLRDSDSNGYARCCTCGKVAHFKDMDAGHFVNRQFKALRFNEKNVNGQCRKCNRFCEGNIPEYSLFMIKKYGKGTTETLIATKNIYTKMGSFEIEQIAKHYRKKAKALAKEKGIEL